MESLGDICMNIIISLEQNGYLKRQQQVFFKFKYDTEVKHHTSL